MAMYENFFEDLKKYISNKMEQNTELFEIAAKKLLELHYPGAQHWAKLVAETPQKILGIELTALKIYPEIQKLHALKNQYQNTASEYLSELVKDIDRKIA